MAETANQDVTTPSTRPGPRMDTPMQSNHIWSRRNFLGFFGWASLAGVFAIWGFAFTRYLFPRVLFEPPTEFKAGQPGDFNPGEVNNKFKQDFRVWIVRKETGDFYALLAVCTHLGCTPRWLPLENKFKCPCHGSGFRKSGINFEGPAPRPLERVKVTLAEDGQIVIDKAMTFRQEKGEWDKDGALLEKREIV